MIQWSGYKKWGMIPILLSCALACGGGSGGLIDIEVSEATLEDGFEILDDILFKPEVSLEEFVETCDSFPPKVLEKQRLVGENYVQYAVEGLPAHFRKPTESMGNILALDNTPVDNPITDGGAALGRALFYDKSLSRNRQVSCASCHKQETGFSDPDRFSRGFDGERTTRHSPGLSNAVYYEPGKFFWDERAETLEEQVLMPIVNEVEMGMTLPEVVERLQDSPMYDRLFTMAFGDAEVTTDRMAKAMAQFIRAMVSYDSKFDRAFDGNGEPQFETQLTEEEQLGLALFKGEASANGPGINCSFCHTSVSMSTKFIQNIGLPNLGDDLGAGGGEFKAPSLRNVEKRTFFMHDGRFSSLEEVIDHYSEGIQSDPNLSIGLIDEDGVPLAPNYSNAEKQALVAFLKTLTDDTFLSSRLFRDPFRRRGANNGRRPGPPVTRRPPPRRAAED